MIVQHDQFLLIHLNTKQINRFDREYNHIKYIGFPSIKSQTHHILLTRNIV